MNFKTLFCIFVKKVIAVLIGIGLNQNIIFGNIVIFTFYNLFLQYFLAFIVEILNYFKVFLMCFLSFFFFSCSFVFEAIVFCELDYFSNFLSMECVASIWKSYPC
jgi:hypothetical protein